jgi:hypothetical protein
MSKSSVEYLEMSGLGIALSKLKLVRKEHQDEDWIAVTEWMSKRIDELAKK